MLCENFDNTPFNIDVDVFSENKCTNAEANLSEPCGPPVDIVFAVDQEIGVLPLRTGKSKSISDALELLDILDENEDSERNDVEVEGKDLISQPCHDAAVVGGGAALGEVNSLLDLEGGNEVNEHLQHQEQVGGHSELVVVQKLPQPVRNKANSMGSHRQVHQGVFVAQDEVLSFCALWASTFDLVEALVVSSEQNTTSK